MTSGALVIAAQDNVATALRPLVKGETIRLKIDEREIAVTLRQDLAFGHKLALKGIKAGEAVVKYGEVIGTATAAIQPGEHVHVHNLQGLKGRGDRR